MDATLARLAREVRSRTKDLQRHEQDLQQRLKGNQRKRVESAASGKREDKIRENKSGSLCEAELSAARRSRLLTPGSSITPIGSKLHNKNTQRKQSGQQQQEGAIAAAEVVSEFLRSTQLQVLDSKKGQMTNKRQSKQDKGQAAHSKRQRVEETATAEPQLNVDHHEGAHVLLSHNPHQEQAKAATEIVRWWDSFEGVDPVEAADEINEDLQKRYRQLRKKGRQKRTAARNAFDLDRIALEMESLASQELNSRIDLPPFSRIQRMQVKAVAAVFLLEARSCGRTGQTFFVGAKTRPATVEGKQQLARLVAGSVSHGKLPQLQAAEVRDATRNAADAAERSLIAAGTSIPIGVENIGNQMLQQMGWQQGQGLGSQRQGAVDPLPLVKRRKRQGLGAE